jgi:hypothetical protein
MVPAMLCHLMVLQAEKSVSPMFARKGGGGGQMIEHITMTGKQKKTDNTKGIPSAELKRRREQSARDKAAHAKMNKPAAQPPKIKQKAPVQAVQKYYMDTKGASLSRLAMSIAAPQHTMPMRLPTVTRIKTDVKKLWVTSTLDPTGRTTDSFFSSSIGPVGSASQLANNQALFVLTRDPLVPGYASRFVSFQQNQGFRFFFKPAYKDPTTDATYTNNWTTPFVIMNDVVAAGDTETVAVDMPLEFEYSTYENIGATSPLVSSKMFGMKSNGKTYLWHPLSYIHVDFKLTVQATMGLHDPGMEWGVKWRLHRFTGHSLPDMVEEYHTSAASGAVISFETPQLPMGHYTLSVHSMYFKNATGASKANPTVLLQAWVFSQYVNSSATTVTSNIVMPVQNLDLQSSTYVLERARVNAASLLITNTAAALKKSGSVFGMRVLGEDSTFAITTLDEIKLASGAEGTGYRGQLAKGAYTFLEPNDDMSVMHDFVDTYYNYSGLSGNIRNVVPYCRNDHNAEHILLLEWPIDDTLVGGAAGVSLMYRYDAHLEFTSNNQLATLGITTAPSDEFTAATITLAAGNYFFENPSHLEQLWNWIKNTGKDAIKAGMYAGARHALEAGALAMGMMVL